MKKLFVVSIIAIALAGCTTLERQAYNAIVGSGAFLKAQYAAHPECVAAAHVTGYCANLDKAKNAQYLLIDALEVYCAGPDFSTGGACNAPKKGTPAAVQATAKLQAALDGYNQASGDLKGAMK